MAKPQPAKPRPAKPRPAKPRPAKPRPESKSETASGAGPTARLEARVPQRVYDQLQQAARLRGMTLTAYIIATAGEDARRTVEDAEILRLAVEDQRRFAEALIAPPAPNDRLAGAARRHAELIAPR